MKLLFIVFSIVLLGFGWSQEFEDISIFGAVLYIIVITIYLGFTFRKEYKKYKTQEFNENMNKTDSIVKIVTSILEFLVTIYGLILMLSNNETRFIVGTIIWFGTIVLYVFFGIFVSYVIKIPLKMGYGGWYVPYSKKRNK